MKPIIYVAGPVSAPHGAGYPLANAGRVARWVKWFVSNDTRRVYIAPWVAEVQGFSDSLALGSAFYQRVLDDDCEVVKRLDGLVGVGVGGLGGWTNGMAQERATTRALLGPVLDMTRFEEPTDIPASFVLEHEWSKVTLGDVNYVEPY